MYQTKKIKELITKVDNLSKKNNLDNILYLDTSNLVNNRIIELQELNNNFPSRAKQIIKKGDILLSQVRPYLNHNGIITKQIDGLIASTGFSVLRVTSEINEYYLFYLLQSGKYKERINMLADTSGSTYPSFKHSDLINTKIDFVTDVIEQEKIGCFFKEIDELIELKKAEIFKLKVILTNYIDKFVMNNIINNPKTLLGSEISSISGTSLEKYTSDDAQMKFISIGNYDPQGLYADDGKRCILNDKTSKYVLSKDDLVMVLNDKTKDGKIIGSTILIDKDDSYIFNQRSEKIICSDNINSNFLWWIINSKSMRRKIFSLSQGGTQIYINFKDIKQIKINIPPITEQIEIVNTLNNVNEIINMKSKELSLLEKKKRYYLNKIFC